MVYCKLYHNVSCAYLFSKSSLNGENVFRISLQFYFNIFSVIRAINLV